ncbi:MAG: hypothetical protein ACT6RN_27815, partial [Agrobacterium sp.]|uniref:hypothetical protein n=1 Tax=Agrobacterium sp. TaxID=361 RepID=UPI0040375F27
RGAHPKNRAGAPHPPRSLKEGEVRINPFNNTEKPPQIKKNLLLYIYIAKNNVTPLFGYETKRKEMSKLKGAPLAGCFAGFPMPPLPFQAF